MKTYEIGRKELEELPPVAVGYKVIDYDGGTKQDFKYTKEIGEPLVGRIFRVDDEIGLCNWGLHFCKNPANVFRFYAPRGYRRYFKVRAYGKAIDGKDGLKSVTECLEFVDEYDIKEFTQLIKGYDDESVVDGSNAVNNSYGVSDSAAVDVSHAVCSCRAVVNSFGLRDCEAVSCSLFCCGIEGKTLCIFNKEITPERYKEVFEKITSFGWGPKFNNFYDLKGDKAWYTIPFPKFDYVGNKTAWSKMPEEMRDYIQSLPEYDDEIFKKITE